MSDAAAYQLENLRGNVGRSARTSVGNSGFTSGPSVQSQAVPHDVPRFNTGQTGLEAVSSSFDRFFGQSLQRGLESLKEAADSRMNFQQQRDLVMQRADIEEGNQKQKTQGAGDALARRPRDPNLLKDLDYTEAYSAASARRDAPELLTQFYSEVGSKLGPTDNYDAAVNDWVKTRIGKGTGDEIYDTTLLAELNDAFDKGRMDHATNQVKYQAAQGQQTLGAALTADFKANKLDGPTLKSYMEAYKKLVPWNAAEAPKFVMNQLLAGYSGNYQDAQSMMRLLNQPGTGMGDQSFAASFPDAAKSVQEKLTADYQTGMGLEGGQKMADLESQLSQIATAQDPLKTLNDLQVGAQKLLSQYGGLNDYQSFMGKWQTEADKYIKAEALDRYITNVYQGGAGTMDVSNVKKGQSDWLNAHHRNPWDNPIAAGEAVSRMGVISDDLKSSLSGALVNFDDPEKQQAALTFYATIAKGSSGQDLALSMMSDQARSIFQIVQEEMNGSRQDPTTILARIKANLGNAQAVDKMSWKDIVKSDTSEADVDSALTSGLQNAINPAWFGGITPTIDAETLQHMKGLLKAELGLRGPSALGDWKKTAQTVASMMKSKVTLVPGPDGAVTTRWGLDNFTKFPFGHDVGPTHENTVQTFRDDMTDIATAMPGVIQDGEEYGLVPDPSVGPVGNGAYIVTGADGAPVVFGPTTYEFPQSDLRQRMFVGPGGPQIEGYDQPVSIGFNLDPRDHASVEKFGQMLKERVGGAEAGRFVLVPYPSSDHPAFFRLGYRPGMKEHLKTAAEKAAIPGPPDQTYQEKGMSILGNLAGSQAKIPEPANLSDLEGQVSKEFGEALVRARINDGLVPPSEGVTKPFGQPLNSVPDITSYLESLANQQTLRQGGAALDSIGDPIANTYQSRLQDFMSREEGLRTVAYDDATGYSMSPGKSNRGNVSVGIGFNMERPGAREDFAKFLPGVNFDDVRSGKRSLSMVEVQRLFNYTIREAENVVRTRLAGVPLREHQRIALVSMAFNNPELIGPHLVAALKRGDQQAALKEILFESNRSGHRGLAQRRYREAQMFLGKDQVAQLPGIDNYLSNYS